MALLGNYSVLNKIPGRNLGGPTLSDTRANWNATGAERNSRFGEAGMSTLAARPVGYYPPYTWALPTTNGQMLSAFQIAGVGAFTGSGAMGVNGAASIAGVGTLTADMQLIVSAVAALTGTGTLTASVVAVLNAAADLAGIGALTATINAIGSFAAALAGTGTIAPVINATGELSADITPFTELSPATLAAAVWEAVAADSFTTGSMGEALNWAQIILRNKTVTDPVAGSITVYDLDGTTVLLDASLWEDAAGTLAYSGSGAENRARLDT
jgi:hypothetical protein